MYRTKYSQISFLISNRQLDNIGKSGGRVGGGGGNQRLGDKRGKKENRSKNNF